jgi:SAM-dependent methyltransferase
VSEFDDDPALLGRAFRKGTVDDPSVQQMVRILDVQDQAPSIRRLREWAVAMADIRPGENVADIGSGTGTVCRDLAGLVGATGRVTGVEPNPTMRAVAEERTVREAVTYVDGSTEALPFDDAALDLIWCERVLQHVDDPQAALHEFARVLRRGGRAVVLDSDHATWVHSDIDPEVEEAIGRSFRGQVANPSSARNIPRQAMTAGFMMEPDVGSAALVFPPRLLLEAPLMRMNADQTVRDGRITAEQADAAVASQHAAARAGWAFSAVTVFGFLLRKPA